MSETPGLISITSEGLSAEIDPRGAQLFTLRDADGRDLLWNGDPAVWSGRAPILFPIVGALAGGGYRLGDASYELPRHGFARGRRFAVVQVTPASATFRLSADHATRAVYPFEFELDVAFALADVSLRATAWVRNLGALAMPASLGFHPAFRWPLPYGEARAAHSLWFTESEPEAIRRLNAAGLLEAKTYPSPVEGRELPLRDALFEADAVIFDALNSRSVEYGAPAGPRLRIDFPETPLLGVWTKPGAGFICIEPWRGVADPEGFVGDFRAKPGVFDVAPGAAREIAMSITWLA